MDHKRAYQSCSDYEAGSRKYGQGPEERLHETGQEDLFDWFGLFQKPQGNRNPSLPPSHCLVADPGKLEQSNSSPGIIS